MDRKRIAKVSGTVVVVGLVAVLVGDIITSGPQKAVRAADDKPSGNATADRAVAVEVTRPTRQTVTRNLTMPATLRADERADLYAKTSGYVREVHVDIGSRVRKGSLLLTIDVPEMADELRQAEAVLQARRAKVRALAAKAAQAEATIATARGEIQRAEAEHELRHINYERRQELRRGNAIPEQELDDARSRLAIAQAQLKIAGARLASAQAEKQALEAHVRVAEADVAVAEANIARLTTLMCYATVTAPFAGVITERLVDPGAFVRSAAQGTTSPLLRLAKIDRIRLALDIPESDASFVQIGTGVGIEVKALGNDTIQASVTRTAMALSANTRTMRAEVDLDNADGRLAPGMYARVVVKLETRGQALVIPSKAIRVRGTEVSVLVADGAVARRVPVKIGYDDGIRAEIVAGLQGDEWIITSADSAVAPGAALRPMPVGQPET